LVRRAHPTIDQIQNAFHIEMPGRVFGPQGVRFVPGNRSVTPIHLDMVQAAVDLAAGTLDAVPVKKRPGGGLGGPTQQVCSKPKALWLKMESMIQPIILPTGSPAHGPTG